VAVGLGATGSKGKAPGLSEPVTGRTTLNGTRPAPPSGLTGRGTLVDPGPTQAACSKFGDTHPGWEKPRLARSACHCLIKLNENTILNHRARDLSHRRGLGLVQLAKVCPGRQQRVQKKSCSPWANVHHAGFAAYGQLAPHVHSFNL